MPDADAMVAVSALPYRRNVGIALFNSDGLVLIARRFKDDGPEIILPGHVWQMPQGGIDPGEDPLAAARRELHEETGVTSADYLGEVADWLSYEFPAHVHSPSKTGVKRPDASGKLSRYRGQTQKWFALRFTGEEREIDVARPGGTHEPEFVEWRWEPMQNLPDLVVPFKRDVYQRVVAEFSRFAA